jgi:hypothetical protein
VVTNPLNIVIIAITGITVRCLISMYPINIRKTNSLATFSRAVLVKGCGEALI